ncbi:MAG: aminoglycoside 6'-N-acetyltransferase [Burkholderiaceae bacterium]
MARYPRPYLDPSPMRYAICPCTRSDDSAWLALRRALFPHHDEATLRAEMDRFAARPDRHAQFLVVDEEGLPVGLAEVSLRADPVPGTRSSPVAFLEAVYVAPQARRHGLARALVTHARAWGRAQGCSEFASDALLDNPDSHALHRALGFEETRRIVCFRQRTAG